MNTNENPIDFNIYQNILNFTVGTSSYWQQVFSNTVLPLIITPFSVNCEYFKPYDNKMNDKFNEKLGTILANLTMHYTKNGVCSIKDVNTLLYKDKIELAVVFNRGSYDWELNTIYKLVNVIGYYIDVSSTEM